MTSPHRPRHRRRVPRPGRGRPGRCSPPWPSRASRPSPRSGPTRASTGRRTTSSWCARTWDYQDRHAEFLDWARRVAAVTTLANSADVLAWNTDKTYLRTLQRGRPARRTDRLARPGRRVRGARGRGVRREARGVGGVAGHQPLPGRRPRRAWPSRTRTALLAAGRTVMVQPYLDAGRHRTARPRCSSSAATSATPCARARCSRRRWSWSAAPTSRRRSSRATRPRPSATRPSRCSTRSPRCRRRPREQLLYARVDLVPGADGSPDAARAGARRAVDVPGVRRQRRHGVGAAVRGGHQGDAEWLTSRWSSASRRPATRPASGSSAATRCSPTRSPPASRSTPGSAAWCPRSPAARTSRRWCRRSSGPATEAGVRLVATSTRSRSPAAPA